MNKLFNILDGIIDNEHRDAILSDASAVIDYAEAAGEEINFADAERIIAAGKNWLDDRENGNGEWGRMRDEAAAVLQD